MEKETTEVLFEVAQRLLQLMSLARANPVLDNLPELSGLQALYDDVDGKWRKLMKTNTK